MNIFILSRRNITFRQAGKGEVCVLMVPGRDQVQVVRDLAGMNDTKLQNNVTSRGAQLSRSISGQRFIYGYLPEEIGELRQAVKVWLAEDFAPADCQSFFYVFSPEVVIHGVREQSDEGYISWRTAQLVLTGSQPLQSFTNAVADYVMSNPGATVCVAVLNQLDLYRQLQGLLEPFKISPIPFSGLKVAAGVRPLYRHMDHTIIYLTGALFGVLVMCASVLFWFFNWSERIQLDNEIENTQNQIRNIQINQSTGHISSPQDILDAMSKSYNQQPSAIIDAAASAAAQYGSLVQINFMPAEYTTEASRNPPQQQTVKAMVNEPRDKLLVEQERRGGLLVQQRPWVRSIQRSGAAGNQLQLLVSLQTSNAPDAPAAVAQAARTAQPVSISIAGMS
ncbi:MAG: hypothetical protein EBR79_00630, partial [Proteobacteria bacterium]|nr:hypothetical protein [Pseudomonadota bacterium]